MGLLAGPAELQFHSRCLQSGFLRSIPPDTCLKTRRITVGGFDTPQVQMADQLVQTGTWYLFGHRYVFCQTEPRQAEFGTAPWGDAYVRLSI